MKTEFGENGCYYCYVGQHENCIDGRALVGDPNIHVKCNCKKCKELES